MKRFVILALLAILIITLAEDYEGLDELHNIEDIEAFTDGILKGEKEEPNIQLYLLPFHKTDIEMTEELAKDVEQTLNEKFEGSTALALSSAKIMVTIDSKYKEQLEEIQDLLHTNPHVELTEVKQRFVTL